MSKRILALALFAVMVLSLVPMAQAAPTQQNVVYEIDLLNQVQTQSGKVPVNQEKVSNFASAPSFDVLTVNSAFADLCKVGKPYNTGDYVRYDLFVKIALGSTAWVSPGQTTVLSTDIIVLDGKNLTVGTATDYPLNGGSDNVRNAKSWLDFDTLTVNGGRLSTEFKAASYLAFEEGKYDGKDHTWAYYYLKVGEFEFGDVASFSQDYKIEYVAGLGTYYKNIRAAFNNSGESNKPIKPLYLRPIRTGVEGLYNVYTVNGVVFIDYAHDIGGADYAYRTYQEGSSSDKDGVIKNEIVYAAIPVAFKFFEDAAATVRVPASGKYAYMVVGSDDTNAGATNGSFFVSIGAEAEDDEDNNNKNDAVNGYNPNHADPYLIRYIDYSVSALKDGDVTNATGAPYTIPAASAKNTVGRVTNGDDKVLGVWLPNTYGTSTVGYGVASTLATNDRVFTESTPKTMKVGVEDEHYRYRTGSIKVVFRPLARNLITTAVIVERYLTIAVGETYKLTIESASATTFDNIKLSEVVSVKSHVYIDGMDVTGLSVGTSQIQVSASGRVIDQITVNVVATTEVTTPVTPAVAQWRVLARKLNIRSGPGTNYGKVGTLAMNQIVAGEDLGNGWVQVGANQFVSKQYVVPVSGSATGIGNYTVNASSLNVRSGPGSSYAKTGSLARGMVVEIIAIQNGWAQLANGGWVSTLYLI